MQRMLIALIFLLLVNGVVTSQTLTISNSGQSGPTYTGLTISEGASTVTITATAGDPTINTSVIKNYLDGGKNVLVEYIVSTGAVAISSDLSKTAGGDATLTLRANRRVMVNNNNPISSSSGKLHVVIWSDYDNNDDGGSSAQLGAPSYSYRSQRKRKIILVSLLSQCDL
ncbi:MAG: hypothetical protein FJ348_04040 [Sphingomonadales bacterium]|nr:hypothetical protein [Sphingomonadales bacterium]